MVQKGKNVKVHYKGMLKDGSVFDSSEGQDPLSFKVGEGQMIAGVEKAVTEMKVGETRKVDIPSQDAYGESRDDMVASIPRDQFPDNIEPKEGMMLKMQSSQGDIPVRVTGVTEEKVEIDANHPLAGKDLEFELTVVEESD
ncbi:MAG: peptidylprolyl isomerase [Kiritimatiellia bacterium]